MNTLARNSLADCWVAKGKIGIRDGCAAGLRQGLAGERSCCQCQGTGQTYDFTSHLISFALLLFASNSSDLVSTFSLRW